MIANLLHDIHTFILLIIFDDDGRDTPTLGWVSIGYKLFLFN